jgi:protein transport protein SEC24
MSTLHFQQQQQQQSQPHFPNQTPYQQARYPVGQPPYNAPPPSFPPGGQPPPPPQPQTASGYSQQTLPPHYPNQFNLSGQPTGQPTMPGSQLNEPNTYPGQPPSSRPVQPSHQQVQYPVGQPHQNAPPPSFPPGSQPPPQITPGYPQQTSSPHYPNQPNLSGPPTMPGNQLNGLGTYSGQPPSSGLGQPSHQQAQYPRDQPSYNAPPPTFPPVGQLPPQTASGYPQQTSPPHYPNQQNLSGPPTMPGSQLNGPGAYPGQPPSSGPVQQPYQPQRIDPDMVPNVVQVLEQSQERNQEPFITNAPGLLPPLVATNFVCQDQGSCNPRFIRATTYTIPNTNDMIKQSHIPIALAISPLANLRPDELEPPVTNFGEIGPVRCHRCKAYMCSFMQFIDGGKRFICCFCEAATDVPTEYFNHLDHSGRRMDWFQRPELCLGSYEILATKQYCKDEKWPEPPAFIFMIDVSYNSVRSGLTEYICHILKNDLLNYLPKDKNAETSTVRVGFATFDKQIHFYNIKNTLGQPQMMIVSDLEDIFVPLLDGFLCLPQDSRGVINSLLEQIPQTFANTQETETILAPVIQSGIQALKGANCTGKIYVFSTTLPITVAPGKLSNRDDKKLLGTEKEKTLLAPVNNIYTKLGEECAQNGCGVDLFVFPNNYLDLATIGEVCRVSGGEIYKFNYFSIENDGERLLDELKRSFQRTTVFDALMRVRTSAGIRPIDFLGNFYMTNATEMIFGTIDSDKSVSVELKHDDKLPVESNTYIQAALLYTSISGQRRLRILTLALTVTSSYTSLYPACDLDAIMNYITKVAIRSVTMSTPKSIRDNIITQAANMLACYRKNCAQSTTAGQLILPETLKLLPVYVTSLIKCDALTGTQTVTTDDRNLLMHRIMSMDVKGTFAYLYPRVFTLHTLEEGNIPPPMIRCSYERFSETGAYLLENGLVMYIWLGSQVNPTFVQSLFGLQSASHIQPEKCRIVDLDNPISKNVRALLNFIRNERDAYMKLFVIQQRDSIEPFFKNYLIEDKGFTGGASYVDFLYHLHREIRNILQ